jgi:hypothetical protein
MAEFGSGLVKIRQSWSELKSTSSSKNLAIQYDSDSTAYEVFSIDGNIVYFGLIFKGSVPDSNYDQVQNDLDKTDFENNYKNLLTNRPTSPPAALDGYSVTTTNPTLIAGSDGSSIRTIKTDSSGRFNIVGSAASGSTPSGNPILIGGSDGVNVRTVNLDSSGRSIIVGAGTGGVSAGGVLSVQGVSGGVALPISGTVTASNPSVGTNNSSSPSSSTLIGGTDGTNLQGLRVFDSDSGAGSQYILGVGLRKSASGGSVELGTSSDPVRIDPTGTTTQPVSDGGGSLTVDGTVTANAGTGNFNTNLAQYGGSNVGAGNALHIQPGTGAVFDVTPASPSASDYLPIRLTDGSSFYTASGGGATFGSAFPSSGSAIGGSDGTNLQGIRVYDTDSGAGSQYTLGVNLRLSSSGGSVEFGTSSNPIRVDTTGSTTQPVSDAGGSLTIDNSTLSVTGGGTESGSLRVTLANDSTGVLSVDDNGGSLTVDGTVAATQSGTWTVQPGNTANTTPWLITINQGGNSATVTASNALKVDGSAVTQPVSLASIPLPSGAATETTLSAINGKLSSLGQKTMANSAPVVIASDQTVIPVSDNGSSLTVDGTVTANAGTGNFNTNLAQYAGSNVGDGNAIHVQPGTGSVFSVKFEEKPTFTALATSIAIGNNKSMLSILNTSSSVITKILEIYVVNVQTTAVTGVVGNFELRRITGHSAGTQITLIEKLDLSDALDSNTTVRTGGTVSGESTSLLWRSYFSTDEWGTGTLDMEGNEHISQIMFPIFGKRSPAQKPIYLRQNQGLTVKFATNSTAGSFDVMIVMTQE